MMCGWQGALTWPCVCVQPSEAPLAQHAQMQLLRAMASPAMVASPQRRTALSGGGASRVASPGNKGTPVARASQPHPHAAMGKFANRYVRGGHGATENGPWTMDESQTPTSYA